MSGGHEHGDRGDTGSGWTDTHCHLQDSYLSDDPDLRAGADAVLDAARAAGVSRFVVIGTDAVTSAAAVDLASRHRDVWATVGLHPHDASQGAASIAPLVGGAAAARIVAVGECGLDYHYEHSPRDVQRDAFAEQIAFAKSAGLALVIHTRDAWNDTFDVLDAEGIPERTVFHCFTGGPGEARACLERGAFLSFSGIVTFKNAGDVREAAALCPADRLLVETDSPFLAPVPHRGRPNEPALVPVVGAAVARVRGVSPQELADSSTAAALLAFPDLGS